MPGGNDLNPSCELSDEKRIMIAAIPSRSGIRGSYLGGTVLWFSPMYQNREATKTLEGSLCLGTFVLVYCEIRSRAVSTFHLLVARIYCHHTALSNRGLASVSLTQSAHRQSRAQRA